MPTDNFFELGRDPARMNDMGREDKIQYPCAYDINPENFPPLKDMKMGDTGEALIRFKPKGDGIEIQSIKWIGSADPKAEADKDKLIKRHKKNQFKQASEPTSDADHGGGYGGM